MIGMAQEVYNWDYGILMNYEEFRKYNNRKTKEWAAAHPEERREQLHRSHKKYMDKIMQDPEKAEHRRAQIRKYSKSYYDRSRIQMSDEELEEHRRIVRERVRLCRARKRAEAGDDPQKLAELRAEQAQKMREYRARKKAEAEAAKKEQGT